jgi:hypothetical protein
MHAGMAPGAHCDQVLLGVVARMAAKLFVVDLQVRHRAARLTPPAVAPQNLLPQSFVGHWIQAQAGRVGSDSPLIGPKVSAESLIDGAKTAS